MEGARCRLRFIRFAQRCPIVPASTVEYLQCLLTLSGAPVFCKGTSWPCIFLQPSSCGPLLAKELVSGRFTSSLSSWNLLHKTNHEKAGLAWRSGNVPLKINKHRNCKAAATSGDYLEKQFGARASAARGCPNPRQMAGLIAGSQTGSRALQGEGPSERSRWWGAAESGGSWKTSEAEQPLTVCTARPTPVREIEAQDGQV